MFLALRYVINRRTREDVENSFQDFLVLPLEHQFLSIVRHVRFYPVIFRLHTWKLACESIFEVVSDGIQHGQVCSFYNFLHDHI